ncbi:unnamed protein product [Arabis nemorensis]|uniref:F-box domain-containing protein n=1 Tax=Arabis nemorensis TaxID=586526 RepID=A0A565B4V5_9BRAS|nr:unnamed protein product [Arabis nemorensis]
MEATKRLRRRGNDGGEVKTNDEASPEFSDFPPEIITEILLRLPAKSIGRFRCVSKQFCSLSSDLRFVKRHTERNAGNRKLLVSSRNLYTVELDSIGEGIRVLAAVELNYPLKDEPGYLAEKIRNYARERGGLELNLNLQLLRRNRVEIIGSSNGLVCIYPEKGGAFLFNPTTGESKKVPESLSYKGEPYGFGFDTLSDDYKVVKFVATSDNKGYHNADVYSLQRDSWRRIDGLRYKPVYSTLGVRLNGAIHWVVKLEKGQSQKRVVVAAFDLKTEKFRDIQLPDDAGDYKYLQVANLKGHLCLVFCDLGKQVVIWVMNEYGVERSWSKIQLDMFYSSMTPLWSSTKNDEEVLLELEGNLVLYNFESKTRWNLKINCDIRSTFMANTYVESLISPNSYGNNGIEI